jgi:hypothetical protein
MTEDELPLDQKLNMETAKLSWRELEVFFAKGTLLQVALGEDLIATAELIATNNQSELEKLIVDKKIEFATPEWIRSNCQPTTELWTLVVAPYVLCQLAEK